MGILLLLSLSKTLQSHQHKVSWREVWVEERNKLTVHTCRETVEVWDKWLHHAIIIFKSCDSINCPTILLEVDHPIQQHHCLHHRGQQQGQAEVQHHPALFLQHGLHSPQVQGQLRRQSDPSQTQTSISGRDNKCRQNRTGYLSQKLKWFLQNANYTCRNDTKSLPVFVQYSSRGRATKHMCLLRGFYLYHILWYHPVA